MKKLIKYLLYILPACLMLSYHPVMRLGESESMYFELSVPLLWLVVFDVVAVLMMVRQRKLFVDLKKWWMWLLFPVWVGVSILWSLNVVRGVLTAGVLVLLYIAGYGIWRLRGLLDKEFWRVWWKWFIGSVIVACMWCVVQCVLDIIGVSQDISLMCDGCTYHMFGFPHPNGWAIEPQFMGNLLLAPVLVLVSVIVRKQIGRNNSERKPSRGVVLTTGQSDSARYFSTGSSSVPVVKTTTGSGFLSSELFLPICLFAITMTLFLTFSRGAIYALVVGLVVMTALVWKKKVYLKRMGMTWGIIGLAFVLALNLQGIMAAVSPTNDTYMSGVTKVLNHLSLGVIDVREGKTEQSLERPVEKSAKKSVEKPVENSVENTREEPVFDGYVAESTDTRLRLSGAAIKVWSGDLATAMFGVGLGGAGQALYVNNLSPAPKEIVQNQYTSLLLETGVVGVSLLILTMVLVAKTIGKSKNKVLVISLIISYMVTLCFFSGLPNALHIYLLPAVLALPCVDGRIRKVKE